MTTLLFLLGCSSLSLVDYQIGGTGQASVPASPPDTPLEAEIVSDLLGMSDGSGVGSTDIQPGDIAEAHADELSLSMLQATGDLSFLDSIEIYVEAPDMDPVLVASGSDQLLGRGPVELDLEDVDLAPFIETGSPTFPAMTSGEAPTQDTTLQLEWTMTLGITAQGLADAAG